MAIILGMDIGSSYSKAVLLKDNSLLAFAIIHTGGNYRLAAERVKEEALKRVDLGEERIVSTIVSGVGAPATSLAQQEVAEILALGQGIHYYFPSVRTVIDVGGQASKVVKLDESGRPLDFALSEKCATGSGKFLQVIAKVLQVKLEELGPLSFQSNKKVQFTTGCAVFAESEAISHIADGASKEDIIAGVHDAIALKIQGLINKLTWEKDCAIVGGGALDKGLVKSIEERLNIKLLVPDNPQIVQALGAALLAGERVAAERAFQGL